MEATGGVVFDESGNRQLIGRDDFMPDADLLRGTSRASNSAAG